MRPIAIVSGAAGGVGAACARLLGRTCRLLLTDIDAAGLAALLSALADDGYVAKGIAGDITDPACAAALAEWCAAEGTVRSIVNAAGLSPVQGDWQRIMAVNLTGAVMLLDALEPLLVPGSAGALIASVAGHLGPQDPAAEALLDDARAPGMLDALEPRLAAMVAAHGGTHEGHAYSLAKRGVIRLCERRAARWGASGARIVSISPGGIWTAMGRREAAQGRRAQALVDAAPAARWGTAMEIASTVEFLVSDLAGYITGCDLRVDGGAVAVTRGKAF